MSQGPIAVSLFAKGPGNIQSTVGNDAQGNLSVAQGHGDFYSLVHAGRGFFGANQTGATTSIALAPTYTGLCLSNPAGSGVNLSVLRVSGVINVAPAAVTAIGLITGYLAAGITAHTTPITALANAFLNGAASVAKLDAACTLVGTPAWMRWIAETPAATSVLSFNEATYGSLLVPPGGYVAIGTSIAGPAAGLLGSFFWEEVAI